MKILMIDGSLGGSSGNTSNCLATLTSSLAKNADVESIFLANEKSFSTQTFEKRAAAADGFVFSSGTYWDSWGSPLQRFFEDVTSLEAQACWLGKPAALVTTMHAVGGKEVLNRLHGVINSFGMFVPPMCGFTYSLANQEALTHSAHKDFWCLDDLEIVADNLTAAIRSSQNTSVQWRAWPVDRDDPKRVWLERST